MTRYRRPTTLDEALALLADAPHTLVAGATDLYPADANRQGWGARPMVADPERAFLDLAGIDALHGITETADGVRIGAMVSWTDAVRSPLGAWFDGVRLAAREVGGPQVQNRGTLVGNVCNASPAADGVPALLALDAGVAIASAGNAREVPLADFITGNRRTVLADDEMVTGLHLPATPPDLRSTFLKLGARRHLVISIAMVAVSARVDSGVMKDVRVAVGACSPVARRLSALEARLEGGAAHGAAEAVDQDAVSVLSPIDDIRASGPYRLHAAVELVRRAVAAVANPERHAA